MESIRFWALVGMGFITTATAFPAQASDASDLRQDQRVGFFLLRDVCHEETQVHLIDWIKTTPPPVIDFIADVSKEADDSVATIDRLEKEEPALATEVNPLPRFEQTVRSSIRSDKQHQLLFGSTDGDFARALLVTQIEASNYILHISRELAKADPNAARARALDKMANRWDKLRIRAFELLGKTR